MVFEPAALLAVRVTVNVPAAVKVWVVFCVALVEVPSPKFHNHAVGLPEEVSVKVTVWPVVGEVGEKVKAALGPVAAAFTVTLWLTELEPLALLAVRVTVKVPAAE